MYPVPPRVLGSEGADFGSGGQDSVGGEPVFIQIPACALSACYLAIALP